MDHLHIRDVVKRYSLALLSDALAAATLDVVVLIDFEMHRDLAASIDRVKYALQREYVREDQTSAIELASNLTIARRSATNG